MFQWALTLGYKYDVFSQTVVVSKAGFSDKRPERAMVSAYSS